MGLLGRIKQLISENEKPAEVTRVMAPLSGEIVLWTRFRMLCLPGK